MGVEWVRVGEVRGQGLWQGILPARQATDRACTIGIDRPATPTFHTAAGVEDGEARTDLAGGHDLSGQRRRQYARRRV